MGAPDVNEAVKAEGSMRRRLHELAETQRWVHHVVDLDSGEVLTTPLDLGSSNHPAGLTEQRSDQCTSKCMKSLAFSQSPPQCRPASFMDWTKTFGRSRMPRFA